MGAMPEDHRAQAKHSCVCHWVLLLPDLVLVWVSDNILANLLSFADLSKLAPLTLVSQETHRHQQLLNHLPVIFKRQNQGQDHPADLLLNVLEELCVTVFNAVGHELDCDQQLFPGVVLSRHQDPQVLWPQEIPHLFGGVWRAHTHDVFGHVEGRLDQLFSCGEVLLSGRFLSL